LLGGRPWCNRRGVFLRVKTALTPRQWLLASALVASVVIAGESLADAKGLRRLSKLRSDIERQEQKNRELREANLRLAKTIKDLSVPVNPVALERAAREQLGFVRPGEILFKFE
jgi:cell division protein FtsB